jgi:hypothetical protein
MALFGLAAVVLLVPICYRIGMKHGLLIGVLGGVAAVPAGLLLGALATIAVIDLLLALCWLADRFGAHGRRQPPEG